MSKPKPTPAYKIADAARLAGVSASTLRLWESHGLLVPARSGSGQRRYTPSDIDLLRHIAWLRSNQGLNAAGIRATLPARRKTADRAAERAIDAGTGRKLRLLRRAAGKTLEQVADEIGIAASALSTFERTSQGISFKTLHDLAHCFGATVSSLAGEGEHGGRGLVRAGEWRSWPGTTPGVTVQVLAEGDNQMDCHRFVLASGASSEGAYRHGGEEFIHLISGRLEVVLDHAEIYDLSPGDSLYFGSRRHHGWTNRHDGETILLWINTPPTF